ncbi:MAG: T9SS type A sorting domain-containing protein [Ignavibacteria bacterium]|nr:T9SS type A sorting domain-containing protein [Ignavibacteria bacterium]
MKIKQLYYIFVGVFVMLIASSNLQSQTDEQGSKTKIKIPKNLDKYKFPVLPQVVENPNSDYTVLQQNFFLTLRDGVDMDASKFYPSEPNIYLPNGYPIVIMVHGYGDRKEALEQMARAQAQYNYVVYTYSVRGQGNSGGFSNLISTTEAQDLIEFVNYVKNDNVGGDSSSVLIMGGSQGGTLPYMASCMGMKVKAIISAVTTPKLASSWIDNGSVKMTLLWTVEYTPDIARYNPLVERMSDWIYATGYKSDKWDSLAINLPQNRDFDHIVNQNTTPILIENSWQDYFFNTRDGIESLPNVVAPKSVYFGAVMGHGGDYSESENQWHMNFFNEFFFHYLWGWNQGLNERIDYHYALTTYPKNGSMWSFVHDSSAVWPPQNISNRRFYFNNQNRLTPTKNNNATASSNIATGPLKNNVKMTDLVWNDFRGTLFNTLFSKKEVKFISTQAFTAPTRMVGTPVVKLTYSSNVDICQYNFQIYEITSTGDTGFVSRINYTDRYYTSGQKKTVEIKGVSHAHLFQPGSKLMVVLTNLDTKPDDWFMNTNPHVLPVLKKGTNKLFFNESYIDIPLHTPGAFTMPGYVSGDIEDKAGLPELFQNEPNPFNPETKISFNLPTDDNGLVSLKIYDMLGREVATLVNQTLGKGVYQYNFNGSNLSSGIYFMRLSTANFSDVKRMLMIK